MFNPKAHKLLKEIVHELPAEVREDQEFFLRLSANFADLYTRFEQLYGERYEHSVFLKKLVDVCVQNYFERSEELKTRDIARQNDHGWYLSEKIVGMMLYVDRFSEDLKGLLSKVDYLQELGVNLVHLMPLLAGPREKNDGGYAVSDYFKVDPKFGTNDDLTAVIDKLHQHNMYLMCDLVINHTSEEHDWARLARGGDEKYQNYYYTFPDPTVPDLFERTLPEVFPENAPGNFTFCEELDRWVMTVFNDYQWDLNYGNPEVLIEMINILLIQANWGIDIFRLDAVAFVWKKLGTTSQNLPEAHIILQLYKACVQIVAPGVALLAEAIVSPEEIVKYFGKSDVVSNECDVAYNATMMALLWDSIATHNTKVLNNGMKSLPLKPDGTTWINYIRCHDDIGLGYSDDDISRAGFNPPDHRKFIVNFFTGKFPGSFSNGMPFMYNPKNGDARISGSLASLAGLEHALEQEAHESHELAELAIRRIVLLHAIIFSYGGIPMLYYGDEVATQNDYTFLEDVKKADDNRWVHRPLINWHKVDTGLKTKDSPESLVFGSLKKMIQVRKNSPEWADHNNCRVLDTGNEFLFAFERRVEDKVTITLANFKDNEQWISLDWIAEHRLNVDNLFDKFNNEAIQGHEGVLQLGPYEFLWLTEE